MNLDVKPPFKYVMIIDDDTTDIYIMSRIILHHHFGEELLKYSRAEEALNYLQENQEDPAVLPKLILVDLFMPVMSGFEFMEAYDTLSEKTIAKYSSFPVPPTIVIGLEYARTKTL